MDDVQKLHELLTTSKPDDAVWYVNAKACDVCGEAVAKVDETEDGEVIHIHIGTGKRLCQTN